MKRLALLAVLLLTPSITLGATFDQNLTKGAVGSEVTALQVFLSGQNLYTGPITGTFGPLTKKALIAFQLARGITPAAGFFGALTRAQANQLLTSVSVSPASTVNPNPSLMTTQVVAAATSVSQLSNAENFTFNGNTYNYAQLPVGMSVVPQAAGWTQATTQYGTVWINNQDFSVPASNVCSGVYYRSCPTGENLVCSNATAYCESPTQQQLGAQNAQLQAQSDAANQAQARYQTQLQAVQAIIQPLKSQEDTLQAEYSGGNCLNFQQGAAQVKCTLLANQSDDIAQYENAILGDLLTPVTDLSIEYENKIDDIDSQIFQLKMTYHQQVAAIWTSGIALQAGEGQIQILTNTNNAKITTLNDQRNLLLQQFKLGIPLQ